MTTETCKRCGYMASNELCKACTLLEGLERGMASFAVVCADSIYKAVKQTMLTFFCRRTKQGSVWTHRARHLRTCGRSLSSNMVQLAQTEQLRSMQGSQQRNSPCSHQIRHLWWLEHRKELESRYASFRIRCLYTTPHVLV
jgi:hypothetical protein